ncbi:MAG: hypothetical protein QXG97_00745 [Nitrososphaerota archaeon]
MYDLPICFGKCHHALAEECQCCLLHDECAEAMDDFHKVISNLPRSKRSGINLSATGSDRVVEILKFFSIDCTGKSARAVWNSDKTIDVIWQYITEACKQ